jgi:hypothetical protein
MSPSASCIQSQNDMSTSDVGVGQGGAASVADMVGHRGRGRAGTGGWPRADDIMRAALTSVPSW